MPSRRYDILAVDLDGTLLDSKGTVSATNADAIRRARAGGMHVVVCTGRGLAECRPALDAIQQESPVVVAGGSIVACPRTTRTLHRFTMDVDLVHSTVQLVLDHGHAALVLKDPSDAGYDYFIVRGPNGNALDPVTAWWFETHGVRVRYGTHAHEDEHPDHTVRVGACAPASGFEALSHRVRTHAGTRGVVHNFPAVVADRARHPEPMHILELFDAKATKWSAVCHLAAQWSVPHSRICAIGDEVNDVAIIRAAGLGIAMGNAVPAVKDVAGRETKGNNEDGVAWAIDRVLNGDW